MLKFYIFTFLVIDLALIRLLRDRPSTGGLRTRDRVPLYGRCHDECWVMPGLKLVLLTFSRLFNTLPVEGWCGKTQSKIYCYINHEPLRSSKCAKQFAKCDWYVAIKLQKQIWQISKRVTSKKREKICWNIYTVVDDSDNFF